MLKSFVDNKDASEYITQDLKQSLNSQKNPHDIKCLIVFGRKKHIIKVFQPQSNCITFGRSTSCSIKLPDQRFPRIAGEIILGPVPLLRGGKYGHKNNEYISILPGKRYSTYPYTLILMEPGDIVINRNQRTNGSKIYHIIAFILLTMISGTYPLISNFLTSQSLSPNISQGNTFSYSKQLPEEVKTKDDSEINLDSDNPETKLQTPLITNISRQVTDDSIPPPNSTMTHLNKNVANTIVRQGAVNKTRDVFIHEDELNSAIKASDSLIGQGKLKMAGRILRPLIQHINHIQREQIITSLDPAIHNLFQRAYMLQPYEPGISRQVLRGIVDSGLEFLPSYDKAKKALKVQRGQIAENR